MLTLAILIMVATSPGQTYGVTFFNAKLRSAFSLSHTELSSLYLVATLLAAATLPLFGGLIDRHGLRKMAIVSVALMGIACLLASQVQGAVTLMLAFVMLRGLGSGVLVVVANNTLAAWFDRRLGFAIGAMQVTLALTTSVVLEGVVGLIDVFDWRGAYLAIAAMLGGLLLPVIVFFYVESPSGIGQLPDGLASGDEPKFPIDLQGFTLQEAAKHASYWILLAATGMWTTVAGGLLFHLEELFRLHGLTTADTLLAVRYLAVAMAAMQIAGGFASDLLPMRWIIVGAVWMLAACCGMIACEQPEWLIPGCALFGMAQGTMTIVAGTAWARFFGRAYLGKIRGTSVTVGVTCSSLGPLLMGISIDRYGSFAPSLWIIAGCSALLGLVALVVKLVTIDSHNAK